MNREIKIKEKKIVSLVVYFDREVSDLISFFCLHDPIYSSNFENYEYIIVNNSVDINLRSDLLNNLQNQIGGDVTIINLSWRHNIEDAMRAGIELSIGDFVFEFDSTLIDYDLDLVCEAYNECINGIDVVTVAPAIKSKSSSRLFYKALGIFSENLYLTSETFKVVSRRMINRSTKSKEVFRYRKANYNISGLNTKIIKYQPIIKKGSKSESSFTDRVSLASNVFIYYSSIGTRLSLLISIFFLLISLLVGVYALISFFIKQDISEGWASIMVFLSLSFSGLFGILALLSKYVEILLKEAKAIDPYTYKSIEKLDQSSIHEEIKIKKGTEIN